MRPGVAAGHPATADIGLGVLLAGGNAADAACAMVLAGCVAETLFTGLGGGGFATYFDVQNSRVTCYDFFVAVPGLDGTKPGRGDSISVAFGGVAVPYDVGGATVAVPGTPAGVEQLHRRHGSLGWASVVRPARDLAAVGAPFPTAHSNLLPDVATAFMTGAGIAAYSTEQADGKRRLLQPDESLFHHGLAETLDGYAQHGAAHLMAGEFAAELIDQVRAGGGAMSATDLSAYRVLSRQPTEVSFGPSRIHLRGNDLDNIAGTLTRLDTGAVQAGGIQRARALVGALAGKAVRSDTTSLVAVDADGNACAVTHSLGLGSGVWVGGVHGNSMLGEGELLRGELVPGERMGSMMTPLVATDADGELVLAGGAAGGSRIRSALLQVLAGTLVEGRPLSSAISRPRLAINGSTVHLEPGFGPDVVDALRSDGWDVLEWAASAPYFGGVSAAGAAGPAADPRRGGLALDLD